MELLQNFVVYKSISHYGISKDIALFGATGQLNSFVYMPLIGFSQALQPIIGINYGSSFMAEPGGGFYIASKLALEGISGTLHYELQPFGIKVIIVEPGVFLTNFPVGSIFINDTQIEEEEYKTFINERRNEVIQHGIERSRLDEPGDPKKAALGMIKVVDSDRPLVRLALGSDALQGINYGLEYIKRDLDAWKEVSVSTDFEEAVANKT